MWLLAGMIALTVVLRRRLGGTRGTVTALLTAALAASLAQAIVLSALPVLGAELHAPASEVTWVLTAFMLASAATTPIAGRLGDMFGYRRVLFGCLGCLAAGALIAAIGTMTHSLGVLVAGRAVQGFSGGVFPLAFGIVRATVPSPRAPGVIALLSAMAGIGGAAGLVVAGVLVDGLGTASLSWLILVLAVVALVLAGVLPATDPPGVTRAGAALMPELLRRPVLTTNLATLVVSAAMFGGVTLVPQYVQAPGFGYTPTEAGLLMLPIAAMMLVASPLSTRIGRRRPRLPLQLGAASAAVGFGVLAAWHTQLWQFCIIGVLLGAGYGLAFASLGNLVVNAVEPRHTGAATGVNTIIRTVGGAAGAQLAATILVPATEFRYVVAFITFGTVAVAAFGATFAVRVR
jgi:MFS family permease